MKYWIATKNDDIITWFTNRRNGYAILNEKNQIVSVSIVSCFIFKKKQKNTYRKYMLIIYTKRSGSIYTRRFLLPALELMLR